jgi:hypothetical protein
MTDAPQRPFDEHAATDPAELTAAGGRLTFESYAAMPWIGDVTLGDLGIAAAARSSEPDIRGVW